MTFFTSFVYKGLRGGLHDRNIEAIQGRHHHRSKQPHKPQKHPPRRTPTPRSKETVCTRCGKGHHHGKFHCPASEAKCLKCGEKEHFQRMCSSMMNAIESRYTLKDYAILVSIGETQPWTM